MKCLFPFDVLSDTRFGWNFLLMLSRVPSKQPKQQRTKKKQMNILKVQATEESPLHSISLYFPDPSAKLTINLDLNLVLDWSFPPDTLGKICNRTRSMKQHTPLWQIQWIFFLYLVKIERPQLLVKFFILPGQFAASPVRLLHTQHISFVCMKTQNSNLTGRGNLVENLPTRWRFYRKPDEDVHATGTVTEGCNNDHESNPYLHYNPIKKVISSHTLQMTTQQETVSRCISLILQPIYLHNLSPHTSPQPITSRVSNGATLSIDQSNCSPGFLNFQQTKTITWLWRWLPHRLTKSQLPTTVLLRTPITQMTR